MSILKAKSQSKLTEFVGVFLPPQTHQYIILHSLAKGITKSELIRDQIERWKSEQLESDEQLIQEIIVELQSEWEIEKAKDDVLSHYQNKVREFLIIKGVPDEYIKTIVTAIK
jgi:hypothetical protein